jgi:hypothetical protein
MYALASPACPLTTPGIFVLDGLRQLGSHALRAERAVINS